MTSKIKNLHIPTTEQLAAYSAKVQLDLLKRPYQTGPRYGQWCAQQAQIRQAPAEIHLTTRDEATK